MIRLFAFLLLLAPAPVSDLNTQILESGRVVGLAESPDERVSPPRLVTPGAPPVFTFRSFAESDRGRLPDLGLMTDDAGH